MSGFGGHYLNPGGPPAPPPGSGGGDGGVDCGCPDPSCGGCGGCPDGCGSSMGGGGGGGGYEGNVNFGSVTDMTQGTDFDSDSE